MDDALATFSDADLKPLVGTLLRAEFSLAEDDNFSWLDWPDVVTPATGRVTVRIMMNSNYDPDVVVRGVTDEAQRLVDRGGAERGELYCFVSASRLEASLWRTLRRSLELLLPDAAHVLDARGLRALANKHVDASRGHIKYWMAQGADRALKVPGEQPFLEGGDLALPRLVETKAYYCAREMLHEKRSIVIHGHPGMGKSTLARMLLADAALDGYQRVAIEDGADVTVALESVTRPAVFVDDVMHPTAAQDIAKRAVDRDGLAIVATRGCPAVVDCYDAIGLTHYDRGDRARMLYNNLWHDHGLCPSIRSAFLDPDLFRAVIDAPQFKPGWCASSSKLSKIMSVFGGASSSSALADEIDGMVERLRHRLGDLAS
ncbi:nSTAND3 domain-containing NTPase [Baekduia sp. Peel2402]|uniref:nSTAND3 domain-containing NTPase n=1 Tax=Baekduia sp. Peel2402 TaxID=3458296 RepID=UPI00403E9FBB